MSYSSQLGKLVLCLVSLASSSAALWSQPSRQVFYRQACLEGDDYACKVAACNLEKLFGPGCELDYATLLLLFRSRCENGSFTSCSLARDIESSSRDIEPLLHQACEVGNSIGCLRLGLSNRQGEGPTNTVEAKRLLRKACTEQGNGGDCFELGELYLEAETGDWGEAAFFFRRACERGARHACNPLVDDALLWEGDDSHLLFAPRAGGSRHGAGPVAPLRRACEDGGTEACGYLAFFYWRGRGIAQDAEEAARLFARACDGGDRYSCWYLGLLYERGDGVARDFGSARRYYQRGCDHDRYECDGLGLSFPGWEHLVATIYSPFRVATTEPLRKAARRRLVQACGRSDAHACRIAGILAMRDQNSDRTEAVRLLRQSCDGGNLAGCLALSYRYLTRRAAKRQHREALRILHRACHGGEVKACSKLGQVYSDGKYVEEDPAKAARFHRQACNENVSHSCAELGYLYEVGQGVAQSYEYAARLYDLACTTDAPSACERLGSLHLEGNGVPQDDVEAARLFLRACDGLHFFGCWQLGSLYMSGQGVQQNATTAVLFYHQACEGEWGYLPATCTWLGRLYETGEGVEQDTAEAVRLYRRGCDDDNPFACRQLGVLLSTGEAGPPNYVQAGLFFARAARLQMNIWLDSPRTMVKDFHAMLRNVRAGAGGS